MKLVTFGILAAMVGAGCAIQAGDPTGDPAPGTEVTTTQTTTPKVHNATSAAPATSAEPVDSQNPEPQPWFGTSPNGVAPTPDESNDNTSPEPSPWKGEDPTEGAGTTGAPMNGGGSTGATSGSTSGSTPNRPLVAR
ncbi:MAG TPA: hypothetical protein VGL81_15490 [Polyangiaceae bacterium]|jgi:hypothetical protein